MKLIQILAECDFHHFDGDALIQGTEFCSNDLIREVLECIKCKAIKLEISQETSELMIPRDMKRPVYLIDADPTSTTPVEQLRDLFGGSESKEDPKRMSKTDGLKLDAFREASHELDLLKNLFIHEDPILWRYRPDYREKPKLTIPTRKMWKSSSICQFVLHCTSPSFDSDLIEPLFTSLCLFDAKNCVPVTEMFHFNESQVNSLPPELLEQFDPRDDYMRSRSCVYSLDDASEDIVLLVLVHRVLIGDADSLNDFYVKGKRSKKDVQKYATILDGMLGELGQFRQPLAWGFMPIFNDIGQVVYESNEEFSVDLFLLREVLCIKDFGSLIQDRMQNRSERAALSRIRPIPNGIVRFTTQSIDLDEINGNVYDASAQRIKSVGDQTRMTEQLNVTKIRNFTVRPSLPIREFENIMYVFPLKGNFLRKHRNVSVKFQLLLDEGASPSRCIISHGSGFSTASEYQTVVSYHDSSPVFQDEIKIILPLSLSKRSHLLLTFYTVHCKRKLVEPIGNSVLMLLPNSNLLPEGVHSLPIATALLPAYLKQFSQKTGNWYGNSENRFQCSIVKGTSVYSEDNAFMTMFNMFSLCDTKKNEIEMQKVLSFVYDEWKKAKPLTFVHFVIPSLNFLLKKLTSPHSICRQTSFEAINIVIDRLNQFSPKDTTADTFVHMLFNDFGLADLHLRIAEELHRSLSYLVDLDNSSSFIDTQSLSIHNSSFWFDLLYKSVCLVDCTVKSEFLSLINRIEFSIVYLLFAHRQGIGLTALNRLNESWAYFILRMMQNVDPLWASNLTVEYIDRLENVSDPVVLQCKTKFLQVLFSSDICISVLALEIHPVPSHEKWDVTEFHQMISAFTVSALKCASKSQKLDAIGVLSDLCAHLDFSMDHMKRKRIIATNLFALLNHVVGAIDLVKSQSTQVKSGLYMCFLWILYNCDRQKLFKWFSEELYSVSGFFEILSEIILLFEYRKLDSSGMPTEVNSIVSPQTQKLLFGSASKDEKDSKTQIEDLLSGASTKRTIPKKGTFRNEYLKQRQAALEGTNSGTLRGNTVKASKSTQSAQFVSEIGDFNAKCSLSAHYVILRILIDVLGQSQLTKYAKNDWKSIMKVIQVFLQSNQTEHVYLIVYNIALYVYKISLKVSSAQTVLWEQTGFSLFLQMIVKQCTIVHEKVRGKAVLTLYHLSKLSFHALKSFSLFQAAFAFALSTNLQQLEGKGALFLRDSLDTLRVLHQADRDSVGKFGDILERVEIIFEDTLEISRQKTLVSSDPTVIESLLLNMVEQYEYLPEVRLDWLRKLCMHHQQMENYAEAAFCVLKSASEAPVEEKEQLYLEGAVLFDKALLYEQCQRIYDEFLLPQYLNQKQYEQMGKSYAHLVKLMDSLVDAERKKYRMLGTYYRIGFYGKKFGRTNGKQFIYKMPRITQLSEVVTYLRSKYEPQIGASISILPDSRTVQQNSLKAEECRVQITYVLPYHEGKADQSFIEENFGIDRFCYKTPFCRTGGKLQSSRITDQCLRITILKVSESFPCLVTRQEIVDIEERELSPVQSATENILNRVSQFKAAIANEEPNKQVLASLLQGSILLQVHGGVKEISDAFLVEGSEFEKDQLLHLSQVIEEFITVCESGLVLFEAIANEDSDTRLKQELEKHFAKLQADIWPLLKSFETDRKKKGRVRFG